MSFDNWDGVYRDWTKIPMEKEYKNKQIEREEVLEPCKELCRKLKISGTILKWRRLDALDMYHENGEPDLEIWIPTNTDLLILLAECKKPVGGVISKAQTDYRNKFCKYNNVMYDIITSVEQLEGIIKNISALWSKEVDLFMNKEEEEF